MDSESTNRLGSGDRGMTSLFSGERVPKSHERIEVCGELDELGSVLGALEAALMARRAAGPEAAAASAASIQAAAASDAPIQAAAASAASSLAAARLSGEIQRIQGELLTAGAWLATTPGSQSQKMLHSLGSEPTRSLEASADRLQAGLPPLESFVLPGGHPTSAWAHVARAVCRRAERRALRLEPSLGQGDPDSSLGDILMYLNRLSFYLFVVARHCNQLFGVKERTWQG
jgi:cob(I)alamin adenosyltransferase